MDRGDEKLDFTDPTIRKIQQLFPDLLQIKISIFVPDLGCHLPDAGELADRVIFTGFSLAQDLIDRTAAIAAERLFVEQYGILPAVVAAMVAFYLVCFCHGSLTLQISSIFGSFGAVNLL